MKIKHLSSSRLDIYRACSKQYFFNYEKTPALLQVVSGYGVGSLSHEALDLFYKRIPTERVWENLEKEVWTASNIIKETDPEIIKETIRVLKGWIQRNEPENEEIATYKGKPAIELGFEIILPNGAVTKGKIDKVRLINNESIEIVDYKSNWMVYTKDEIENSMQLAIYTLAAKQMFPWATTIHVSYDFLRHAPISPSAPYSDEELNFVVEYLQHMWEIIKADTKPVANVSTGSCRWCAYQKSCPEYQDAIKNDLMPGQGQTIGEMMLERKELAARVSAIDGRKKEIDQLIMSRIKSSDSKVMEVQGVGKARLVQSRKIEYPSQVVHDVLGNRAYMVSSVTKSKVDKILPTLTPEEKQRILDSAQLSYSGGYLRIDYEKVVKDDNTESS